MVAMAESALRAGRRDVAVAALRAANRPGFHRTHSSGAALSSPGVDVTNKTSHLQIVRRPPPPRLPEGPFTTGVVSCGPPDNVLEQECRYSGRRPARVAQIAPSDSGNAGGTNLPLLCDALNGLLPRWRVPGFPEGVKIDGGRLEPRPFQADSVAVGLVTAIGNPPAERGPLPTVGLGDRQPRPRPVSPTRC